MEEIDLKELFQMFLEKKMIIIVITIIAIIIGAIYTNFFVVPKYQASTTLLLATNNSSNDNFSTGFEERDSITTTEVTINSKLVSTYSELVKSNRIIRTVISNLGLNESESAIRNSVDVSAVSDTEVIQISVKNTDPILATKIANEIAKVFISTVEEFYGIENVYVVDVAEVPTTPCNINHVKDICIFAFIGIVCSVFYIFMLTMIDNRIKSSEEIEDKIGVSVLASFPVYEGITDLKERRNK